MNKKLNEIIIDYLKQYGFIIPNSEIYGGLSNSWDYGHLGVLLKNNVQNLWWKYFVLLDKKVYAMDSSIMLSPKVWGASGHINHFSDILIDCKSCKKRFRVDHFLENFGYNSIEKKDLLEIDLIIDRDQKIKCLNCNNRNFTKTRRFNLMFQTQQNITNDNELIYLRPETAQAIFINYKNVQRVNRAKLPFAIAQVGKSFRNEVTLGNGIFRTKEFEQMEIEWFCFPNQVEEIFEIQLKKIKFFLITILKISEKKIFLKEIQKGNLAHYSKRTVDIEFSFPHAKAELWGIANRFDFDLNSHQQASKQNLTYYDEYTKKHFLPWIVEPSVGLNRLMYAIICNSYCEEILKNEDKRIVLKIPFYLAPYQVCVLPLSKNQSLIANLILNNLISSGLSVNIEESGSIGKRYRRNDAIGTPYCVTCDFETCKKNVDDLSILNLNNALVTIRDRDSMKQIRMKYGEIKKILISNLNPFEKALEFNWNNYE